MPSPFPCLCSLVQRDRQYTYLYSIELTLTNKSLSGKRGAFFLLKPLVDCCTYFTRMQIRLDFLYYSCIALSIMASMNCSSAQNGNNDLEDARQYIKHHYHASNHQAIMKKSFCSLLPTCVEGDCSTEQQCRQGECKTPPTLENSKVYDVYDAELKNVNGPYDFRIRSPFETIKQLLLLLTCEIPAIYIRFGDGDMKLSQGASDLLHTTNPDLQYWLKYAFVQRGFNVIKSYPFMSKQFGYWNGMRPGRHLQDPYDLAQLTPRIIKYFVGEPIYDSTALHHTAGHAPDLANALISEIKSHCPIFIGNINTPLSVRNALFGAGHQFIPTPPVNAWSTNKEVYTSALKALSDTTGSSSNVKPYKVVVFSMGCAGRAMAAKLWGTAPNAFFFDFGSLMDYLGGNVTREWMKGTDSLLNVTAMILNYDAMPSGCAAN